MPKKLQNKQLQQLDSWEKQDKVASYPASPPSQCLSLAELLFSCCVQEAQVGKPWATDAQQKPLHEKHKDPNKGCRCHFSAAVSKCHDQSNSSNLRFILAHGSRGIRIQHRGRHGLETRKKRVNWKWGEALCSQLLLPTDAPLGRDILSFPTQHHQLGTKSSSV